MVKRNWLNGAAYSVLALGALCPILTIIGDVGNRTELLSFRTALGIFMWIGKFAALPIAGVALLVFIATIFKKAPRAARISSIVGLILALSIGIPYYVFMAKVQTVPKIHDITTDTEHPPVFVRVPSIRKAGLNSLEYEGAKIAQQQLAAYPEVRPAYLNVDKTKAFAKALGVVKDLGWEVVEADETAGRIEATDTTLFFGFKDDIVIRITEAGPEKSRIDIRSASRVGVSDVGVNAARILDFLHKMT